MPDTAASPAPYAAECAQYSADRCSNVADPRKYVA
jgi:hypothetical protein